MTSLDHEVVVYHKKQFGKKNRKEVGSGVELFLCREKIHLADAAQEFLSLCAAYGQLMVRDEMIAGMQVHIPLTGERMAKEHEYTAIVHELRKMGYVVVQSIVQTKEYPLVQRSITDPTLVASLIADSNAIENTSETATLQPIISAERRNKVIAELIDWCEENDYKTDIFDDYDIIPLRCDS